LHTDCGNAATQWPIIVARLILPRDKNLHSTFDMQQVMVISYCIVTLPRRMCRSHYFT